MKWKKTAKIDADCCLASRDTYLIAAYSEAKFNSAISIMQSLLEYHA